MKNNLFYKNCFKKAYLIVFLIILSVFANAAFSRTLIFQSDSEKKLEKQSEQNQVAISSDINPQIQVNKSLPSSANSELFFMIEQLQQEVNTLRGLLEEQSYELRMLKQSSKDRYLDLDTRILDITKRLSVGSSAVPNEKQILNYSEPVVSAPQLTQKPKLLEEKVVQREPTKAEADDYQKAYAFIKNKQFDDSVIALFSYTENYPDSPLLPNVYYWLGEVYLATSKYEQAKTSFSLVVSAYPNSQKVSDSLYKLGVTADLLGEKALAKQYINDVQLKYPESTAAKLAASYQIN